MNNKNNDEKNRLEILERFLGFLGVMIALVMTVAWDFISSSKFETISKQDQISTYFMYFTCLLTLGFICFFYFWLYLGYNESAETTGNIAMFSFIIALFLGIASIRPYILPVLDEFLIYGIQFIGGMLISFFVFYYLGRKKIMSKLKIYLRKIYSNLKESF